MNFNVDQSYNWIFLDLDNTLIRSSSFRMKYLFIFYYFYYARKNKLGFIKAYRILNAMQSSLYQEGQTSNIDRVINSLNQSDLANTITKEDLQKLLICVFSALKSEYSAIPGALELVQNLKKKYHLVLATNPVWPLEVTLMRLNILNLKADDFIYITHNENMSYVKPNPNYFRELLFKIKAQPNKCLMIGDNPLKDGPAEMAGIKTIIINPNLNLTNQIGGLFN